MESNYAAAFFAYMQSKGAYTLTDVTEPLMIDEWCIKHPTESINSANHRIAELQNFIAYSNKQRYTSIPLPLLLPEVRKQRKGIPMTEMPFKILLYLKCLKNIFYI